jgi:tRNA(Glu) U13 pseudouridine synthase TruD
MQHGFGEIITPDGKLKKGKFENNQFVEVVKDDTKKPEPLEDLKEDSEEEM